MSTTLSGWQSRLVWGLEANIGTAATPSVLWPTSEKDTLKFNDKAIDFREMFTGVRGAVSTQLRQGNYSPEGGLGAAPMYLNGSSLDAMRMALAFFQSVSRGTLAEGKIYTYTFSQVTTQPADSSIRGITVCRDTGMGSGNCPVFVGGVVDSIEWAWDFGGAILWTPTIKSLFATENGTAPGAIDAPASGFLQAPNLSISYNGTAIYPVGWNMTLNNGLSGVTGPATDAFRTFSFGRETGKLSLKTWRDDSFFSNFIAPYNTEAIGTFIVTAKIDAAYGTFGVGGSQYTAIWTAYTRVGKRGDLALIKGDQIDTVELEIVRDVEPSLVIHSAYTGALTL